MAAPYGSASKLKTEIARPDPLVAPIAQGQAIATLKVSLDGQTLSEQPLIALDAVPEAGWLGRMWDSMRLWLQ